MHVGLSVQKLWMVPNFKFRSLDPGHAHFWGHFLVHWIVHALTDVHTKYEVSLLAVPKI